MERERLGEKIQKEWSHSFLQTNLRDEEWGGFGVFTQITLQVFFFLSKKIIFLYGLLLFFLPFFLVSFLKILTTEFSNEEDVAIVVFCWRP